VSNSFRRSLTLAVVIQGIGAAVAILTLLGIARWLGPTVQGNFAIYKNWYDVVTLVLLFGTPQGIIYAINRDYISQAFAAHLSVVATLVSIPVIFFIGLGETAIGYLPENHGIVSELALALGCAGYICHGLSRSILLTSRDGLLFSLISIAPTIGIAAIITFGGLLGTPRVDLAFMFNGLLCAACALASIANLRRAPRERKHGWRTVLFRQSSHFFVQSVLFSVQPLIVYALLQKSGDMRTVGIFSFALIGPVAINALIGMVAPILYNRWSKDLGGEVLRYIRGPILWASALFGAGLTLAMFVLAWLAVPVAGAAFAGAVPVIQLLAWSSIPLIFTRVAQPALLASGRTEIGTIIGLFRLACVVGVYFAATGAGWGSITAAALGWSLGEWVAAIGLELSLRRNPARATQPA